MGQKVNPHGLRVGVIKDWDSRWFAKDKDFGDILVEDYNIRKFLKKKLFKAGVPRIEIERDATKVRVHIHCSKPGMVIGKGGTEIEKLRQELDQMINKGRTDKKAVYVNIVEVKQPDLNAQLVAESIADQLVRRISFRRAMKMAIGRTMRLGAKGIKTQVSGRLGGADIARTEHYHEGTIPLQTLRADIDYGFAEADTTFGKIGVKVWIYRGEILKLQDDRERQKVERAKPRENNSRDNRDRRPPRRDGGNRSNQGGNRGYQGQGQGGNRNYQGQGQGGNRNYQGQGQGGNREGGNR